MYVCICHAVTDKDIRRAAKSGIGDLASLKDALGVATGCGSCEATAMNVLADCKNAVRRPPLPQLYRPVVVA